MKNILLFIYLSCTSLCLFAQEMIFIPDGDYIMGTNDPVFTSQGTTSDLTASLYTSHKVEISKFNISKYEIDSKLFYEFLIKNGRPIFDKTNIYEQLLKYNNQRYFGYPAVSTYLYALEFCNWLSKKNKSHYRLPTEAEWEYVATGGYDRKYPWGNTYKQLSDDTEIIQRVPMIKYIDDISPFGTMNTYGNVAEWVMDLYQYDAYLKHDSKNPVCIDGKQLSADKDSYPPSYVVRGKNLYYYNLEMIEPKADSFATIKRRYVYWHNIFARTTNENIGFRIVEDTNNAGFNTHNNIVKYCYKVLTTKKKIAVFDWPLLNGGNIVFFNKGEIIIVTFETKDIHGDTWWRVQNTNITEYKTGVKLGDDSIVGWIRAF